MFAITCPRCEYAGTTPAAFCPECGAAWPPLPQPIRAKAGIWSAVPIASAWRRIGAYLLDFGLVVAVQTWQLPVIGEVLGAAGVAYLLLRDMNGASLGKAVFGLRVTDPVGTDTTMLRRIGRNVPLSVADLPILLPIPGLDLAATAILVGLVFGIELVMLLATGRRIGDRLAGTTVVRRNRLSRRGSA